MEEFLKEEYLKERRDPKKLATKMEIELIKLNYEDNPKELCLTTLEVRRKWGDIIQIYKIKNRVEKVYIKIESDYLDGLILEYQ